MSILFTQHHYNPHHDILPSMEQDDNCSDTDTVIDTPTSFKCEPSSWLPPHFDNTIHPSQRPFSSPMPNNKNSNTRASCPPQPPIETSHYQTTIRRMSQHIEDFLQSRHVPLKKPYGHGPSSTGDLIEMIHQYRADLNADDSTTPQQVCDTLLAWIQQSPTELENEKNKNKRLVHAIHQLAQRHHTTKQTHRTELKKHRSQHAVQLQQEIQSRKEAEEILDSVRIEMEAMMSELDTVKQQLFTAEQETQHVREQWQSIIVENSTQADPWALLSLQQDDWEQRMERMTDQVHRLTKENEDRHELHRRLLQAERQAAEYDLQLVVLKSQQNKMAVSNKDETEKDELITALQHELVEKESALARWEKKWQQQTKQWQQQQAIQHQSHLVDHQAWQQEYKAECQKENDLNYVRITRHTRELEGQLLDVEMEKERLEACLVEHQQRSDRMDKHNKAREAAWTTKQSQWDRLEKESKATILDLEQKVIGLEADTVRLYGKNIILAKQLGECD